MKKELLIVDGYNMIGSWPELVRLKNQDKMADARDQLLHELSNYAKYEDVITRVVFDAQLVPGIQQKYQRFSLEVIFTKEGETADSYIERTVGDENQLITNVTVATSDLAEQWMVFQKGAARKSANELLKDIKHTKKKIKTEHHTYRPPGRIRSPLSEGDLKKLWAVYDELASSSVKKRENQKK